MNNVRKSLTSHVFNELTSPSKADMFLVKGRKFEGGKVPETRSEPVTELLAKWRAGDDESLHRLMPLVYNELRRLAHNYLRNERPDHTLQSAALVHEAYLRLIKQKPSEFENRAHFFAICAQLMRQILVQYARRRNAAKRDAGYKLTLDESIFLGRNRGVDLLALDDALKGLAKIDQRQSRVVELRFFAGLSIEETSQILGVSAATVKRDWNVAKLWLYKETRKRTSTTSE